jgi:hypothetical protein
MELADLPAFLAADARIYGLTRTQVERAVEAGILVRLGTGVVAGARRMAGDRVTTHLQLVRAAQLRMRRLSAASHGSAALVHGLARLGQWSGRVRLTCDRDRGRYRRLDIEARLHVAGLPLQHVMTVDEVMVTTPARTVVDLSRNVTFRSGVVLADSALRAGTTVDELRAVLDYCRRWPGRRRAIAVVEFATGLSESPLESVSRVLFADAGLPTPELQAQIFDGTTFVARVDFRWGRVIGEADGMSKYDDPLVLRREKLRQMQLEDLGFQVVRWTWDEVWRRPEIVLERLRRAFRRAA